MDPKYIWLPKSSRESLDHQGCLTACILGEFPSLHGAGKPANRLAKYNSSLVFLMDGNVVNLVGVVSLFAWQVLSMASYFGVPVVLLTMSFRVMPKYFPQLRDRVYSLIRMKNTAARRRTTAIITVPEKMWQKFHPMPKKSVLSIN